MNKRGRTLYVVETMFFVICISLILATPAHAYLDPGSGSFILQILIASIVGALFLLKQYWRRIWGAFKREQSQNTHSNDAESNPENTD